MKQFDKPSNFDGAVFLAKLDEAGIAYKGFPHDLNGGDLWIDVSDKDVAAVKALLDSYEA